MDELVVPEDFATATDAELTDLTAQARAAAAPLVDRQKAGERLTDEEISTLENLAGVVTKASTEQGRRVAAHSRAAQAASIFATETTTVEEKPEESAEVQPTEETLTAAVPTKLSVGQVAKAAKPSRELAPSPDSFSTMVAAVNAPGPVSPGQTFETMFQAAQALEEAFSAQQGSGSNTYVKTPVVQIRRNYPQELTIGGNASADEIESALKYAADINRLPGGALTAAAGWCAPSQILYGDFAEYESTDGMLDLPELQVNRGGINFTRGPDFSTIFTATGLGSWNMTEAQVIAIDPETPSTLKPCMVVACPSFTESRLRALGICITGDFLQNRGYPELVARFTRGALVSYAHIVNRFVIDQVVAGVTSTTDLNPAPVGSVLEDDNTAASRLLAIVGMAAMDLRYKHRMRFDTMLEAVLPFWVTEVIRADIQRRTGQDPQVAFELELARINRWLAVRGVRVQWVYDWQDAFSTSVVNVGTSTPISAFPTDVEMLLYPAGTFVKGVSPIIRLDSVYDSTNLAQNLFTQLWMEEGVLVARRGHEARRYQFQLCPTGITSGTVAMDCA